MKKPQNFKALPVIVALVCALGASTLAAAPVAPPPSTRPSSSPSTRLSPTIPAVEPLDSWIARQLADAATLAGQRYWAEACEVYIDIRRRAPLRRDFYSKALDACIEAANAQTISVGTKKGFPPRCLELVAQAKIFGASASRLSALQLRCALAQTRWRIDDALHVRDTARRRKPEYQFSLWKRVEKLAEDTRKAIEGIDPKLNADQSRRLYARALALYALAQSQLANYRGENRQERLERARTAITRARTLSPNDPLVSELGSQVRRRVWGRTVVLAAILAMLLGVLLIGYWFRRRSERQRVESFMSPNGKV